MLYIIIIIISITGGLLRGGELDRLSHITIEGIPLFAIALLLRLGVWLVGLLNYSSILKYGPHLIIISYFLLTFVSIRNIKLPGFKYIILGLLLNGFVIVLNGGKMPVLFKQSMVGNNNIASFSGAENRTIHFLINNNTLFAFLGDVFAMPKSFPTNELISVGDIMIFVGLFIFIQKTMMKKEPLRQEEANSE